MHLLLCTKDTWAYPLSDFQEQSLWKQLWEKKKRMLILSKTVTNKVSACSMLVLLKTIIHGYLQRKGKWEVSENCQMKDLDCTDITGFIYFGNSRF